MWTFKAGASVHYSTSTSTSISSPDEFLVLVYGSQRLDYVAGRQNSDAVVRLIDRMIDESVMRTTGRITLAGNNTRLMIMMIGSYVEPCHTQNLMKIHPQQTHYSGTATLAVAGVRTFPKIQIRVYDSAKVLYSF